MSQRNLYKVMVAVFVLITAYIPFSGSERGMLGPLSLLFLLIFPLAERLLRLKLGDLMKFFILLFCTLAFQLGVLLQWYDRYLGYDNFMHLASGVLFTVLGLCLYGRFTNFSDRRSNPLLQISYAFFFSMFVAVVWEIGEFLGFILTGHDAQHHLDTGVFDTMEDLIACFAGSLLTALDYGLYLLRGRSPLMWLIHSFDEANQPHS